MQSEYDLMVRVARHLAREPVIVRMTKPEGLDGLCWRDDRGRLRVDVNPGLSDETMMYVFCHELGHSLHDNFRPATEAVMKATPLSKTPIQAVREDRADSQARAWMEYGERHRDKSLDYYESMLWALLTYQEV
jgi:hypothetical protein